MKQETKATIAYLAAIIFVIICIALMAVTPAYGQNQTVIKDSKGEVVYVKIKTASGYIVKDKNGVLLYTVVENDTEKRVYDASGRLISVEKKAKKMKTMKDQVTSIEQSKRLIDLGVPAEKASMAGLQQGEVPTISRYGKLMLKQKLFYIKSFPMDISPPLLSPTSWERCFRM